MSRALAALCALLLLAVLAGVARDARALGLGRLGAGHGKLGAISQNSAVPQPTGDILLVDGVSLILQTDAASFICRAGGC